MSRPAPGRPTASSGISRTYCQTCHNDRLKTGGLSLEGLTLDRNAETWEKVVRKVRAGMMPPAGAKRPERAALDGFAGSIESAIDRAAAVAVNPGRAPLHRMNRAEYENAIRDLLALEVDSSTLLPADDSSRGFDNIADVLGVSPSLLERYVAAAAKVSRLAVGERDAAPAQVTYTVKGDLSQNQTLDGQPLGTRGGTTVTHNFPVDGEYVIRLALLKLSFGQVFGEGAEGEELEVTLNGQRVKLFKLDEVPMFFMRESPGSHPAKPQPTDPVEERVKMTPDIRLELRLKVKAGPQTIGVAFLQKARLANEDLVRRPVSSTYDVFIGMQVRLHHGAASVARGDHRAVQRRRYRRDTQPASGVHLPPVDGGRRGRLRETDRLHAGPAGLSPRPDRCGRRSAARLLSGRARQDRQLRRRDRDGAAPDPGRSRVHLPLRAATGGRPGRDAVSHHRHRAGVTALLLPVVVDSGRRAVEAGDRRPAAPAGRARTADAPDAGRSEGAGAGRQLRQPVAVPP